MVGRRRPMRWLRVRKLQHSENPFRGNLLVQAPFCNTPFFERVKDYKRCSRTLTAMGGNLGRLTFAIVS